MPSIVFILSIIFIIAGTIDLTNYLFFNKLSYFYINIFGIENNIILGGLIYFTEFIISMILSFIFIIFFFFLYIIFEKQS